MRLGEDIVSEVRRRLRRVQGQLGGIIGMLEEGRDCRDVIQQLAAASKALDRAAFRLMASGLRQCIEESEADGEPELSPEDLERLFLQLS